MKKKKLFGAFELLGFIIKSYSKSRIRRIGLCKDFDEFTSVWITKGMNSWGDLPTIQTCSYMHHQPLIYHFGKHRSFSHCLYAHISCFTIPLIFVNTVKVLENCPPPLYNTVLECCNFIVVFECFILDWNMRNSHIEIQLYSVTYSDRKGNILNIQSHRSLMEKKTPSARWKSP